MQSNKLNSVEIIKKLVSFNTTSKLSNLELIHFIADYLSTHGLDANLIYNHSKSKANLYALIGPEDIPGIVLSGHTDVVPVEGQEWESDPFHVVEKDGRLFGRGTSDMKSFIGVVLAMIPKFQESALNVPIHLAFSFDEEIGCLGAPLMIKEMSQLKVKPRAVIVGEPTQMRVVNAHKGVSSFRTVVRGLERHSSETNRGVNAVEYAGALIHYLNSIGKELRQKQSDADSRFDPPYTTVHVGTVMGGTAQNIVPLKCEFTWEYRMMPGENLDMIRNRFDAYVNEEILPKMHAVEPSTGVTTEVRASVPGLIPEKESDAERLVLALARQNSTLAVSYGTEGGQYQEAGNSVVICGPGSISEAHKPNEFIELSQIRECEIFFQHLIDEVCNVKNSI